MSRGNGALPLSPHIGPLVEPRLRNVEIPDVAPGMRTGKIPRIEITRRLFRAIENRQSKRPGANPSNPYLDIDISLESVYGLPIGPVSGTMFTDISSKATVSGGDSAYGEDPT